MSKPDLMVLCNLRPDAMAQLEQTYTLHRHDLADDKASFLAEHGRKCRALATNGHVPLTAEMIASMPSLEFVACVSAGYESIDIAALKTRGITLTNTSVALADDVADMAFLLMLAGQRGAISADAWVRSGDWGRQGMFPLQRSLTGKRLGIVGMGAIAQKIGDRAEAFRMPVAYWNRRPKDVRWPYQPDLVALARDCDVLVVIVAGGEGTRGLISAEVIEALGPNGLLVNVARGTVVDEAAMIAALSDGSLGHAALDVYLNEPNPDPRLNALPNVTLSPHHASGTVETRDAMAQMVVDNLAEFFAGRPAVTPVAL